MKKTLLAGLVGLMGVAAAGTAMAQQAQSGEGPWMVRVRAVNMDMANKSEAGSGALNPTNLPADGLAASDKTIPEVDISYFFTKNLAMELILTVPQKHNVNITKGPLTQPIGSFKHLPPTLLLQYHFMPDAKIRPYVGAGINYTKISGVNLQTSTGTVFTLDGSSTGGALQAGFDVPITKNLSFNFDIKKIYIETDVKIAGAKVSNLKLDPLMVGVGLGWRF
jgi:outer membrane protein